LMLTAPTRTTAWKMLREVHLAPVIFRFLPKLQRDARGASVLGAVAPGRPIAYGLALAASSLDIAGWSSLDESARRSALDHADVQATVQATVRALRQALKISNVESEDVSGALEGLAPLLADVPPALATKKRFLAQPTSRLSRDLLDAFATIGAWPERIHALQGEFAALEQTEFAPPPLVTGDDLTAAGLSPGPTFKRV